MGEVDQATTLVWRAGWQRLWHAEVTAPVVLADFTGVTFFGSAGITVLLDVLREVRERRLTLVIAASGPARRSLQIAGIDSLVTLYDTLDEARTHTGTARAEERPPHVAHWKPSAAAQPGKDANPAELVRYLRAENEQLREALDRRTVLEQAKGIVMAQHKVSPDDAFELLKRLSQHTNVKVYDLALQLISRVTESRARQ
ncbi:ANTAR domain-containing protein [Amycolatopsis ultiminotia]|uniref:ANTAR domain-containing protein n=1 Tax=Amycolatopsis ultiminotia TaxID=543629 RepID=UPI0031EFB119